jgi:hypothetical protein
MAETDGVGGHGLLGEDVLVAFHRVAEVHRTESRRRGEQDDVDPGVDELLEGVESNKGGLGGDGDARTVGLLEAREGELRRLGEGVGDDRRSRSDRS